MFMFYCQKKYADYKGKWAKRSHFLKKGKCLEALWISTKITVVFLASGILNDFNLPICTCVILAIFFYPEIHNS